MAGLAAAEQLNTQREPELADQPELLLIISPPETLESQVTSPRTEWTRRAVDNVTYLELVDTPLPVDEARPARAETHGRSLRTIYRVGVVAVEKTMPETTKSPEAEQAKIEFFTSVEEGFGTDKKLGKGLEVRVFDTRPIIGGKVMSKDLKTAVSDMTEAGLVCAEETAKNDKRFMPQFIRSGHDNENAVTVDKMAEGETDYNTRIVVTPFPEEAAKESGNDYWDEQGYVSHLRRGFVQIYHSTGEAVIAGSLSFDGSDKVRLREVFGKRGVEIPETETTDNWLKYAITGNFSEEEAKDIALGLANEAGDPKYKKTTNTVEITCEHRAIMDMVFNESYIHACESLVRGYQTPGVRPLVSQLASNAEHFNNRYRKALHDMWVNTQKFTDDDMVVLHELLVYSTIEMMRALHLKETKLPSTSNYQDRYIDAVHLQSLNPVAFQSALSSFGAEGARNNRSYSACGLSISPGETDGFSSSPQQAFGGRTEEGPKPGSTEDGDKFGSLEFDCPKCRRTNRRPRGKLIPNCQKCGADVTCK